jgi:putative transposase
MLRKPRFFLPDVPVHIVQRGRSRAQRCEAYRELFKAHVDDQALKAIRDAWQTGTPLGNDIFREKIEKKLKCKVGHARRGRPSVLTEEREDA